MQKYFTSFTLALILTLSCFMLSGTAKAQSGMNLRGFYYAGHMIAGEPRKPPTEYMDNPELFRETAFYPWFEQTFGVLRDFSMGEKWTFSTGLAVTQDYGIYSWFCPEGYLCALGFPTYLDVTIPTTFVYKRFHLEVPFSFRRTIVEAGKWNWYGSGTFLLNLRFAEQARYVLSGDRAPFTSGGANFGGGLRFSTGLAREISDRLQIGLEPALNVRVLRQWGFRVAAGGMVSVGYKFGQKADTDLEN